MKKIIIILLLIFFVIPALFVGLFFLSNIISFKKVEEKLCRVNPSLEKMYVKKCYAELQTFYRKKENTEKGIDLGTETYYNNKGEIICQFTGLSLDDCNKNNNSLDNVAISNQGNCDSGAYKCGGDYRFPCYGKEWKKICSSGGW